MAPELQVRQLQVSDEEEFSLLQDRCFNVPQGQHYLNDFPVWNGKLHSPAGGVFKLGAFDGERLVGAAAIRLAELLTSGGAVKLTIGLIGAVATDSEYRGKGIASKLAALLTEWASHRAAAMTVLWGSEYELYQRIGFIPCGRQVRVPLSAMQTGSLAHNSGDVSGKISGNPSISSRDTSQEIQTGWNEVLFQKMKSRKVGLERTDVDLKWIQAQTNVQWYWSGPEASPQAYAAFGRGIDLGNLVHEWGGDSAHLFSLLAKMSALHPTAEILGSPETFGAVGIQFDPSAIEYLCLARVIDPLNVFRAFISEERVPYFDAKLIEDIWHLEIEDRFGKESLIQVNHYDLPRLFFGPKSATSLQLQKPWSNLFPLPLWFWGLDAV